MGNISNRKVNMLLVSIISILMIATGFFLIFYSIETLKVLIYVVAASVLLNSIYNFAYIKSIDNPNIKQATIARSIIMIVSALMMLVYPMAVPGFVWIFLIYISSIFLISSGIIAIAESILFKTDNFAHLLEGIFSVIIGLILLVNTENLGKLILVISGIIMVILGIFYFVSSFKRRYDLKEVE